MLKHVKTASIVFIPQKQKQAWWLHETHFFSEYTTFPGFLVEHNISKSDLVWEQQNSGDRNHGEFFHRSNLLTIITTKYKVTVIVSSSEDFLLWLVIVCMFSFKTCSSIFWLQTWVGLLRAIFKVCMLQTVGALYLPTPLTTAITITKKVTCSVQPGIFLIDKCTTSLTWKLVCFSFVTFPYAFIAILSCLQPCFVAALRSLEMFG